MYLEIGDIAPDFNFIDKTAKTVGLSDYLGKKVILFFYPKDNTPGCTAEACNLRDNYSLLLEKGFEIIGVSPDSETSHNKFSTKFELPFILVPDEEKKILENYKVWGEKKMYGKSYMGVHRTTYIIDEKGKIEKVFKKVKTKDHTAQILKEYE